MSSQQEPQKSPTTQKPTTPARGASPGGSAGKSAVKASLRGHGFEQQESMLAPGGADAGGPPADPVGAGSSGPPADLPFRAELEASFGQDLGHIKVFLGKPGPLLAIGARALTQGTTIVFADSSPDKTLVAEEVAHVLQNAKGRGSKPYSTNADGSEKRAKAAATRAASGEKVDADSVGSADADVQAGWLGNTFSAIGGYISNTWTYVKESVVGDSKSAEVQPDQWRDKQHEFMKRFGDPAVAEDDLISKPRLRTDMWFGTYFVYHKDDFRAGVDAWAASVAQVKASASALMPRTTAPKTDGAPTHGTPPAAPDAEMPEWLDFKPIATKRDGIPVMKEEEFATLSTAMEESRSCVKQEIVQILDASSAADESAVKAISRLKDLLRSLRAAPKQVDGAPPTNIPSDNERRLQAFYSFYSSTGEEVPEIYSHPIMAGNPEAVLALADLLDPIADLKTSLEVNSGSRPACIAIIMDWSREHPDLGTKALSDPTIEQIIYTSGGAALAGGLTQAGGTEAAVIGAATLNPLAGFTGVGMMAMGGAASDQMATVDPDTLRMIKLLQNGGHLEGTDVESTAREALISKDSEAFLRAWGQIVHQKEVFTRLTTDDRFRKDVREKVPDAWDSFLTTIKAGAIETNLEAGLTAAEQKLVEQYSNTTVRELADAFNPGYSTLWMVRDASVTNALRNWNQQVSNILAVDQESSEAQMAIETKLNNARYIMCSLFAARQGKTLEAEIKRGVGGAELQLALGFIGITSAGSPAAVQGYGEAAKIDHSQATTVETYGEKLSDDEKAALKYQVLLKTSGELYKEFERYSFINLNGSGALWGTSGATVIGIIEKARGEARKLLAPPQLDKHPALQKPFSKKVTESMVYLAEVYNDAYEAEGEGKGSLRLRISRELAQADQQRTLQLIGATPAPTQHLVDAAMAQIDSEAKSGSVSGAAVGVKSGAVEKGLDALQTHASKHALILWQQLQFSTSAAAVVELGKAYTSSIPVETTAALNMRPALKGMPMQMLEAAYRILGGSLGGHIVQVLKADAAGAQTALDAFGLGAVGRYAVAEDAELMSVLTQLDKDDAALVEKKGEKDANRKEIAANTQKNAEMRALVQAQIPVRQQLAWLSGRIFGLLETAPVAQDEVTKLVGEMAAVGGHLDAPVEAIGPNLAVDGVPSVRVLDGQRLDVYVYKHYQGIELKQHLGQKLDDPHRASAAKTLGFAIDKSGAPKGDVGILNSKDSLDGFEKSLKVEIDTTRVHGNIESKDAWEGNQSFIVQAAAIVKNLDRKLVELETVASSAPSKVAVVGAGLLSGGLTLMAHSSAFQDAKRELMMAVGEIGTGEERRVVDALFEKAYGVSLKFRLNKVSMVAGDENAEQMRRLAEGRLTAVDHLRAMAESGNKDEVYRHVFKAAPEMQRNILKDDHLLRLIATKFGTEFLQNIMRVCEGTQQAADLLHGRDADDGGGGVKGAFWSWVASMGWSTDEEGMKSDLQLHLGALKDKITQAKSKYVIVKGDCLWNITEHFVGAPMRWKELYAENADKVGDNPNLIYPNVTLKLPSAWVQDSIADNLAKEYLRIVLDPDVRSLLGEQLSAKDRFEMESIIMGGGSVSVANQATIELNAANSDGFIASIKQMSDAERKALLSDATVVALMSSKFDGATYQQAMSILATGKAYDTLSDLLGALSGNDYGIVDTIDEAKIFDALAAMGPNELARLKKSPVLAARVQSFLDKREDESVAFKLYIDTASEAPPESATPDQRRVSEMTRMYKHLIAKYSIQLVRGNASDRDKLYAVAMDVYKERGEIEVPVAGPPVPEAAKKGDPAPVTPTEKVKVFEQDARELLWGTVGASIKAKHSVELATMLEGAVRGTKDPSSDRIEFALTSTLGVGKEVENAKAAIGAAANITVAREWSNIILPDQNALTLKDFYTAFTVARHALNTVDQKIATTKLPSDRTKLQADRVPLLTEYYRRFTEFKGFRLDLSQTTRDMFAKKKEVKPFASVVDVAQFVSDHQFDWLNAIGAKDQLELREAVRARIGSLPKEVVGQAIGIVNEDGKLLAADGKVAAPGKDGTPAKTSTMTLGGSKDGTKTDVGVESADLDLLMSDDRAARMGDVSAKEKYEHTRGDTFIGKSLAGNDLNKSAANVATYNAMLDQSEERKDNEEVSTIDAGESAELKVQLAAVNRSLADYAKTKAFYSEIIKGVVVAVIAAVSTALTGGAAGPLWATMLTAAISAGAKVAIDEMILGNDYEALADGIPMIIGDTLKAGLEQSLAAGVKSLAAGKGGFSKALAWKLDTQEALKGYLKKAGPLKGAMTEALMGGFGVVTDPWLDPVTRYLKPETWGEVYKHGLQSSWQTGMNKLDKSIQSMPKAFVSTVATTFLSKYATRSATKVFEYKYKPGEPAPGLPGLNVGPVRPEQSSAWDKIHEALAGHFNAESGGGKKAVYDFLVKQLVAEGILSLKDGHGYGDSWTEEGLMALVVKFGTERVTAFIKTVGDGAGAYTKDTTALKRVKEESAKLTNIASANGLDPEKMKDMYYLFITSGLGSESTGKVGDLGKEANNHGGYANVSAEEFQKFFLDRRLAAFKEQEALYAAECAEKGTTANPASVNEYKNWLFADPMSLEKRTKTSITTYETNAQTLAAAGLNKSKQLDLTEDERQMYTDWSQDASNLGDITKGKFDTKLEFAKSYLVTKQTATMLNLGKTIADKNRKAEFKVWLQLQDRNFWNKPEHQFSIKGSDIPQKVAAIVAAFDKESPLKLKVKPPTP